MGMSQADLDNHSRQLDPENDAYWESRGWDERPDDWEDRLESGDILSDDD
ncbi:consensus disorder prediction [Desulfoluna spongiiphila]|nr:consensus disorder prediction [Desulfoluna spongiiphila]